MKFTTLPQSAHEMVVLRPLLAADVASWYAYLSRPEVYEHTSWNLQGPDELAPYAWKPDEFTDASPLRFAVALRSPDVLVGTVGFHTVSPLNRTAEIAYDLAPSLWGKGITTSVCNTLVAWAHEHVGIVRVQAAVLESNARSSSVLTRCGFEREGLLRSYRMVRGQPRNFWMYSHVLAASAPS